MATHTMKCGGAERQFIPLTPNLCSLPIKQTLKGENVLQMATDSTNAVQGIEPCKIPTITAGGI